MRLRPATGWCTGATSATDGTIRAMYHRNQKDKYTIRDGKFTANGNPTLAQHKCK
jgi:hypothetical protein